MKKLFYSIYFIPFFILSCAGDGNDEGTESNETDVTLEGEVTGEDEIVENAYGIEPNMVGIFQIGHMVPEKLPEGLKIRQFNEADIDDEGNSIEHTHNVIFNQLEDVVELIMQRGSEEHHEDKQIEEMMVLSNYYATDPGVSVGTSIEEFEMIYSDMTVWYDKIHDRYFLETEQIPGGQFILDPLDVQKKAKGGQNHQRLNKSNIKDGAKIKIIRIIGS